MCVCECVCPSDFAVNVGEDCPVFDGMHEFCQLSAGGSIGQLPRRCGSYTHVCHFSACLIMNYPFTRPACLIMNWYQVD